MKKLNKKNHNETLRLIRILESYSREETNQEKLEDYKKQIKELKLKLDL